MKYPPTLLENLYRTMVRIRACEESLVAPIISGEVRCPCHLYSGEEAIAAGVCASLTDRDYIFGTHRSHGHFLAKGGDMNALVAEVFGRDTGCSRGRGGSMHLIDPEHGMLGAAPIVAGTISLAVGAALASKIRKDGRATVTFFGDGATGEGVLYESMNFASLQRLPLVFVCENNLYSTHMPIADCRVSPDIHTIASPFCIPSSQIDGNDVLEVYESANEAIGSCRVGRGPFFLECLTYRQRGHVGPDDNVQETRTDIRPREEIEAWLARDPIGRFRSYLVSQSLVPAEVLDRWDAEAEAEARTAMQAARESAKPNPGLLTNYVFQNPVL